jgi:hypothetical protein
MWCDTKGLDPEYVGSLVRSVAARELRARVEKEARELRCLKPTSPTPPERDPVEVEAEQVLRRLAQHGFPITNYEVKGTKLSITIGPFGRRGVKTYTARPTTVEKMVRRKYPIGRRKSAA